MKRCSNLWQTVGSISVELGFVYGGVNFLIVLCVSIDGYDCVALNKEVLLAKKVQVLNNKFTRNRLITLLPYFLPAQVTFRCI